MPALFEAYVTNLGKYNEGALVGEYLKFPTTPEEVQALLKRIGVDGVRYEEIFITDFNGDVLGLYDHLGEYENLDELNHLACLLSELDQSDLEKFEAVIDSGEHTSGVADLINLTQNLDCFEFYSDVHSDEELGRMYVLEFGGVEVPEQMAAALQFMQEHQISEYSQFSEEVEAAAARFRTLTEQLRQTEADLAHTSELMGAVVQYAKTRPVFDGYKAAKYSRKYLAAHEAELADYRAAKAALNDLLGGAKLPRMSDLKEKRRTLEAQKKALYADYWEAQQRMREAVAVKANIDDLLGLTDQRKNKEQER